MDTTTTPSQNKIIIYSTENCRFCHMMKEYLKDRGFAYEDIDVGKDAAQKEIAVQKSGQLGVPVTDVNGHIIVGYDTDALDELLNIK